MTISATRVFEASGEIRLTSDTGGHPDINYYSHDGQSESGYSMAICALPSRLLRSKIYKVAGEIREKFPGHSYVPRSYLHMTVAPLGTVAATENEVEKFYREHDASLRQHINNARRFQIAVQCIGHFSNCLYAQVSDESDADTLDTLHDSLMNIAEPATPFPFVPHITMAHDRGNPYARNRYTDENLAMYRIGKEKVRALHLTAFDTQRSIYENPYKIVASYPLDP